MNGNGLTHDVPPVSLISISAMPPRHNFMKILFLVGVLKVFIAVVLLYSYYSSSADEESDGEKVILAWTYSRGVNLQSRWQSARRYCEEKRCTISNDRGDLYKAAAVIFNLPQIKAHDLPLRRRPDQQFIFYSRESPQYINKHVISLPSEFFTLSMTYRNPSDINHSFGTYLSNKVSKFGGEVRPKVNWNLKVANVLRKKTKMVAWFVSNCRSNSKREGYVAKLSKHITVDIFGQCSNRTCDNRCMQQTLSSDYLFFIAFENSVCKDYITEKMWRMRELSVPIVLRQRDAEALAPPNSFIAADSFATPLKLAKYLQQLAANRTEYLKYFEWRKVFWVPSAASVQQDAFCRLCKRLHSPVNKKIRYIDVVSWWLGDGRCIKNFADTLL